MARRAEPTACRNRCVNIIGVGTPQNPLTLSTTVLNTIADHSQHLLDDEDLDDTNELQTATEVPVLATGNLTGTNVQLALEGLQTDLDNLNAGAGNTDEQNIQGSALNGETLTIGIENGDPEDISLAAFALETEVNALIAASEAADQDTNATNELQNITSDDGSVTITATGNDFNLRVAAGGGGGDQNLSQVLAEGNDAGGATIINLLDSPDPSSAVTKAYVDANLGGGGNQSLEEILNTDLARATTRFRMCSTPYFRKMWPRKITSIAISLPVEEVYPMMS